MPWWIVAGINWLPALALSLGVAWLLDLPIGAAVLLTLLIAAVCRFGARALRGRDKTSGKTAS
jgi:hypothetical protein